jgi:hypothetical protein
VEEVEVTVSPDGKVTVHVRGVQGQACLTKTQELISLLGGDIEDQELTTEAFIQIEDGQEERQWH